MKKIYKKIIVILLLLFVCGNFSLAQAASVSDLQKQKEAAAQKAAAAQALATQKAKEKAVITAAISDVKSQIAQLQKEIDDSNSQIADTQDQIASLTTQMQTAEDNLKAEQDKMNKLVVAWYIEGDNSGLFNTILNSDSLSSAVTKDEYYESVKEQISTGMDKINLLKSQLAQQKSEQDARMAYLSDLKKGQTSQQQTFRAKKNSQDSLLQYTSSALASYTAEQQQATAEVARLTRAIQDAYASVGIGGSGVHHVSGMSELNVPYFSQRNPQWSSMSLGNSGYTIGAFGCLISSYAMVSSFLGSYKTPADIDNESSFDSQGNFLSFDHDMGELNNYRYRQSVNYGEIDSQLSRGKPVMVGVSFPGVPQHWIVLTGGNRSGGYAWNDPYPVDPNKITSFIAMRTYD